MHCFYASCEKLPPNSLRKISVFSLRAPLYYTVTDWVYFQFKAILPCSVSLLSCYFQGADTVGRFIMAQEVKH
jgi:hypothetical protein